ncbi:hypothetical protein O181_119354 [Austropuccinia psidii MF-1]|uniref:Uncharacterized protein n=1 Tax=Austropuccinia psidii MF-1 TaxID=1389203 RepID=A0A9Q3KH03_9BASI|nr:hypothetical protein [Austropuccinia psidii MF-1]
MMLLTAEWRKNNPPPPKQVPKTAPVASSSNSHKKKKPQAQNKGKDGQNKDVITENGGIKIKISEMIFDIFDAIPELYEAINDVKSHISDKNSSICNNPETNNLGLSQINETCMCFAKVLRTIKTSNNDNPLRNKLNEQSSIIKELTGKYSKFNIEDIIETRIKQAVKIIKEDNKQVLDDIANSFTEVKTYTIALKKCCDTSQQELLKLTMKLNQVTFDNTRQTELWQELTHKEDMYKIEVVNLIQSFQNELRKSQRCRISNNNYIEQLLHTLPRISTPLNKNEGTRIPNPQVLEVENSQLKN